MPVYTYNGVECVSAGVLFYRKRRETELLFLEKTDKKGNPLLEDPGGKSQADDASIETVAAREAAEELNAEIQDPERDVSALTYQERVDASRDYILSLIKRRPLCIPNARTKYALFLVGLPYRPSEKAEQKEWDFGVRELHPKFEIQRRARWISPAGVFAQPVRSIHPRIRHLLKFL
jgi:8-oxo-dGTP pyrophosphatase MutT (NUDIX family)